MARFMSLTYGVLPTRAQFDRGFYTQCPDGKFSFGNDKRVGNDRLTCSELWREVCKATDEFNSDLPEDIDDTERTDSAGDWVSSVLGVLGIEWV